MIWLEPEPVAVSDDLLGMFPGSYLLAEQLAVRGIQSSGQAKAFLDPHQYTQHSPYVFNDMRRIVKRIQRALRLKEKIGVWGDFDVDGQTSTALLVESLKKLGADVSFYIPVRARESHGIQAESLKIFLSVGIRLLITCDTGITENDALEYAQNAGVDTIVSDHHTPGKYLPSCLGIINPCLLPDDHAMRHLAGVGTAFQITRALFEDEGLESQLGIFHDLVALGTVADVAALTGENRFYTQMGLIAMRAQTRPAIKALLASAGLSGSPISESLFSYALAPRLNAIGRLADANKNVSYLLSQEEEFLLKTSQELEVLNSRRKDLVEGVFSACLQILEKRKELTQYPVIVLDGKNWEKGVIGIAASRLAEKFHKPVLLFNSGEDISSGSARSVEGINMIQAIRANEKMLIRFGGHPMAAGLSLPTELIPSFREALSSTIQALFPDHDPVKKLQIDGYVSFANLNARLCDEINQLSPFGAGNPAPVLVTRHLEIQSHTPFGKQDAHRKLVLTDHQGEIRQAIMWNASRYTIPIGNFDLAFTLRPDPTSPYESTSLEYIDHREAHPDSLEISERIPSINIQDYRTTVKSAAKIMSEMKTGEYILWGEGISEKKNSSAINRLRLKPARTLAILSAPPDSATLAAALRKVNPREIFLFAEILTEDTIDGFLKSLAGLIKYCQKAKNDVTDLCTLAAALGHSIETVKKGLKWWQARGMIEFLMTGYQIQFTTPSGQAAGDLEKITKSLEQTLMETASFRSYYMRADPTHLISQHLG